MFCLCLHNLPLFKWTRTGGGGGYKRPSGDLHTQAVLENFYPVDL